MIVETIMVVGETVTVVDTVVVEVVVVDTKKETLMLQKVCLNSPILLKNSACWLVVLILVW